MTCYINGRPFSGLVDTGADVSVIMQSDWPQDWPLRNPAAAIVGIGGMQFAKQSAQPLLVLGLEGQRGHITRYVMQAPCTLWGRDLLSQWGVIIRTNLS